MRLKQEHQTRKDTMATQNERNKHWTALVEEMLEEARTKVKPEELTEEQKKAHRLSWNNRIMNFCGGGNEKLMSRVHARRAKRARRSS